MTSAVSTTEFRNRADQILDAVVEEETVIVTLPDGRKLVLLPDPEWQSMDETAYLTSTALNPAPPSQILKQAAEGRTVDVQF